MKAGLPRLKWHMLRRRESDPAHLRENLDAGLRAGAALEVDLVATADGAFVCLHDLTLDRETTGSGPVAERSAEDIRRLRQRSVDGAPLDRPPLFFDEVVAAVARNPHHDRQVQLDFKVPARQFGDTLLGCLRRTLGDLAPAFIVGTTDAEVYARVRAGAPEIAVGFDPLALHEENPPTDRDSFAALADETLRLGPDALIYYLNADLVLAGLARGINLVERVTRNGAEVDAWTVDPTRPNVRDVLRALVEAGCRQITTNGPEALLPMLQEVA
jgi:glycerophosphoryl diester phosphodiesterase